MHLQKIKGATATGSRKRTDTGSGSSHLPDRIIDIVGATNVYEPPITTGNLVPNHVCNSVFNPATNNSVWITFAFSSWKKPSLTTLQIEPNSSSITGNDHKNASHFHHPFEEPGQWEWWPSCQASPDNAGIQEGSPPLNNINHTEWENFQPISVHAKKYHPVVAER